MSALSILTTIAILAATPIVASAAPASTTNPAVIGQTAGLQELLKMFAGPPAAICLAETQSTKGGRLSPVAPLSQDAICQLTSYSEPLFAPQTEGNQAAGNPPVTPRDKANAADRRHFETFVGAE